MITQLRDNRTTPFINPAATAGNRQPAGKTIRAKRNTRHIIDHRASISLFGHRYYIRFLLGPEARSVRRLKDEGQISLTNAVAIILTVAWLALPMFALIIGLGLYLVKSFLGIDFFDGPSFLHPLIFE